MFLVEQAWWYYEDNVRDANGLRSYSLRDFAELVFRACPELKRHAVRRARLGWLAGADDMLMVVAGAADGAGGGGGYADGDEI